MVFDEAHRAAGLGLIPTMAKECRKYGIALILASQEAKDFNVSLFSAIANYLVLRLTETDARALVRNVASSQQERVLIDKIKQMDQISEPFTSARVRADPLLLLCLRENRRSSYRMPGSRVGILSKGLRSIWLSRMNKTHWWTWTISKKRRLHQRETPHLSGTEVVNPEMTNKVTTIGQLESHLWEAANILRGPVDAADFKTYVFPLLFFKRISDVFDEEYMAALAESDGDEEYARFPQNYRFQIPKSCHWNDIRVVTTNVGQALQKAMRGIETANPETLYGIFGDAGWSNKDRLPDSLLRDLIEHFSRINFGNQAAQSDVLGQSYEYLIKKFADLTNKKAGEFYTPRSVVRLMVSILDPKEGESIYDPACGTGGIL